MNYMTPHQAQTGLTGRQRTHDRAGGGAMPAMHPERAAVAGHLKHMHSMITSPGMADHPLTASEGHMLTTGAEALTRAANTVS